jgi:hypothetical protein
VTLTVGLLDYPEAILAADAVSLDLPPTATATAVVGALASRSPRLREALMHADGVPRRSTKVLANGVPLSPASPVPATGPLTVLAALPCDG